MTKAVALSSAERAVYHLAEAGSLDALHAPLYASQVRALVRAGLLRKRPDGGYEAVRASSPPPAGTLPPPAPEAITGVPRIVLGPPPEIEPMVTLNVRVPAAWIEQLDQIGPTRADAARTMLGRVLARASGTRRAAG